MESVARFRRIIVQILLKFLFDNSKTTFDIGNQIRDILMKLRTIKYIDCMYVNNKALFSLELEL